MTNFKLKHEDRVILIGICGYARTGKDTLGYLLSKRSNIPAKTFNFARDLKTLSKDFIMETLNIDVFTDKTDEKTIIRPFLVGFGESCRLKDPFFWVRRVSKQIDDFVESSSSDLNLAIINDNRFSNESEWIKSHKYGYVLSVDRENITAPNEQERINIPEIRNKFSNFSVNWVNIENACHEPEKILTNKQLIAIVDKTLENIWKLTTSKPSPTLFS